MKRPRTSFGFTLIELLVVIGIIALLASIAVPAFTGVQIRAAQTKALNNAKQIGLSCKQYAIDNNGQYPNTSFTSGTGAPASSNDAFDNLLPAYLTTIQPFYQVKSAWTPQPTTDPNMANVTTSAPALPAGTNEWAYVLNLYDTSSSTWPMIVNGFATGGATSHEYTNIETAQGGVWKGNQAIVVFVDDSAKVMKCSGGATPLIIGSPNGKDEFDTSQSAAGWLGTNNTVVQPL